MQILPIKSLIAVAVAWPLPSMAQTSANDAFTACGPTISITSSSSILTNDDRATLGIRNGPDSVAAELPLPGCRYIFFSGYNGTARGTYRIWVDENLSGPVADPADSSGFVIPVMQPGKDGDPNPAAAYAIIDGQRQYMGFDRDYAGGGTVVSYLCSDTGQPELFYFYHGENHTDDTGHLYTGALAGWTGIGLAVWDDSATRFRKVDQIIGLNKPNTWSGPPLGKITEQTPPASGQGNALYNPNDGYFYLFYNDRSNNPDYVGGLYHCENQACPAVARAYADDVCFAVHSAQRTQWFKYFLTDPVPDPTQNYFTEPGIFTADDEAADPQNLEGTGGRFTPLFPREGGLMPDGPFVYFEPACNQWTMVYPLGHAELRYRTSSDGLQWSDSGYLLTPDAGDIDLYTGLFPGPAGQGFILTFTRKNAISWSDASLERRDLLFH